MADLNKKKASDGWMGFLVASVVIAAWAGCLYIGLFHVQVALQNPLVYVLILVQTHLYTGLFITAHDAMHGLVSQNKGLNNAIGSVAAGLFAFNYYTLLKRKHHMHHATPTAETDPDFYYGGFWSWYWSFIKQYVTIFQIALMAVAFNLLKQVIPTENLILFWMIPAILSTFQLFYFGTYLPHRGEHAKDDRHKARSQEANHLKAFLACYFFGYHQEHHAMPWLPWYKLPGAREASLQAQK